MRISHFIPCLIILISGCNKAYPTIQSAEEAIRSPAAFPIGWNQRKVDVVAVERDNVEFSIEDPEKPVPFLRR